jgi:hypothetical protein
MFTTAWLAAKVSSITWMKGLTPNCSLALTRSIVRFKSADGFPFSGYFLLLI